VAILLVLLDHTGERLRPALVALGVDPRALATERILPFIEAIGLQGVHIFFTLSGYLITYRLLREAQQGRISLREFYLRRLFRIQPAALTYLVIVGVLSLAGVLAVSPAAWRSALFCYANLSRESSWYTAHFWSLAIEEQFYLVWPLLFIVLGARRRLTGALALTFGLSLWRAIAVKYQVTLTPNWIARTDMQAEYLMWGCTFALLRADETWNARLRKLTGPIWMGVAGLFILLAALPPSSNWKVAHVVESSAGAFTALLLFATSFRPRSYLSRFLDLPAVAWLGRISYSLYLWQQLFCAWDIARAKSLGWMQDLPWSLGLSLGAAVLSHYLVERPLIRIGRDVIKRLRA